MRKGPGAGDAGERKGSQDPVSQMAWGHSTTAASTPGRPGAPHRRRLAAMCGCRARQGRSPVRLLPRPRQVAVLGMVAEER